VGVVSSEDLPRANALEAVFVEVAFVGGPALAAVLAYAVGPVGVLVAEVVAVLVAAAVTRGLPAYAPAPAQGAGAPWRERGARPVYLLSFAVGLCMGLVESAVPARMPQLGLAPAASGFLLVLVAVGSAVAGLLTSGATDLTGARRRAVALLAALGLLLVPVALAPGTVVLGLGLLVFGAPIAPLNALGSMVLSVSIPRGRQAEGFALYLAAILLGAGLGQAATGTLLAWWGPQVLLAVAGVIPLALAARVALPGTAARPAPASSARG
jgi:MFS family permease